MENTRCKQMVQKELKAFLLYSYLALVNLIPDVLIHKSVSGNLLHSYYPDQTSLMKRGNGELFSTHLPHMNLSTEYQLLVKDSFRLPFTLLWIKVSWLLSPASARIIIWKLIKHIWTSTRAITYGDRCCQLGRRLHVLFVRHLSPLDHNTSVCTFLFYYDNTPVQ